MSLYGTLPQGAMAAAFAPTPEDNRSEIQTLFDNQFNPQGPSSRRSGEMSIGGDVGNANLMDGFQLPTGIQGVSDVLPRVKKYGLMARIHQQPGGAKALIALGAGLLSGKTFGEGLGQGALAYQSVLDREQDKLNPQMLADGSYSYTIDPETGKPIFERTQVGQDQMDIADKKLRTSENNTRYRTDRVVEGQNYRSDQQYAYKREELEERGRWNTNDNDTDRYVADAAARSRRAVAQMTKDAQNGKPPPAGAMRILQDNIKQVDQANNSLGQGDKILGYLEDGTLQLGVWNNLDNKMGQLGIGSDAASSAKGELDQFIQTSVNAILMDANGVQTDGDAERAAIQSYVSKGDNVGAAREIRNLMRMMQRGRDSAAELADDTANAYNINSRANNRVNGRGGSAAGSNPRSALRNKYGLE